MRSLSESTVATCLPLIHSSSLVLGVENNLVLERNKNGMKDGDGLDESLPRIPL